MSAIGVLQESRESPSTLLLRFASLHSHISTIDGENLEEESAAFYQDAFEDDSLSALEPIEKKICQPAALLDIRVSDETYQLQGLVTVKPLRIKKRKTGKGFIVHHVSTRDRRAPPRSPRLPRHHPASRSKASLEPRSQPPTPGTTKSLSPFTSLGYSFLNMVSMDLATPLPPILLASADPIHTASIDCGALPPRKASLASSEFHLGLGHFTTWDGGITPGPSPPGTPAVSPTKRTFTAAQILTSTRQTSSRPAEPMTPSRAGSKAIQVLGMMDASMKKFTSSSPEGLKVKKREHFRPLPSAIIRELDNLFGRTSLSGTTGKQGPITDQRSRTGKPLPAVPTTIDERKVGRGKIVDVTDSQGQVWQDLEEQAEFAWLLSEQGRGGATLLLLSPIHLSDPSRSSPAASTPDTDQHTPGEYIQAEVQVVGADDGDMESDDPFGMPTWKYVYDVPKPHKAPFVLGTKAASTLGVSPGEAASRGKAFLATDPYAVKYAKGRQAPPEAKHRPPPLRLAAATKIKPVDTIAVQQDFVDSRVSPIAAKAKGPTYNRSGAGLSVAADRASRVSAYARPRLAPTPPRGRSTGLADRVEAVESGRTSFLNAGSHSDGLATLMTKKVGGFFRRAT